MIKKLIRNNRIVFIDVETTGLDPRRGHRIIEIGAIAMADNYIIDEFQSLIRVNRTIPRHVSKIHGITDEMLTDQPGPEDVFPYIKDFISGSILVAHNAEFDMAFLCSEFHKLNLSINNQVFCTLKMSRRRYPRLPNYKLSTVYRHLVGNHPADARKHRALDDARMVAAIWLAMEGK